MNQCGTLQEQALEKETDRYKLRIKKMSVDEDLDFDTEGTLRIAIICHLKIEKEQCEAKLLDNIQKDFQ